MFGSPKGFPKFLFGRPSFRPGHPSSNAWEPKGLPEIFLRAKPWQTYNIRENSSFEEPGCISVSLLLYSHLCKLTMKRLKK